MIETRGNKRHQRQDYKKNAALDSRRVGDLGWASATKEGIGVVVTLVTTWNVRQWWVAWMNKNKASFIESRSTISCMNLRVSINETRSSKRHQQYREHGSNVCTRNGRTHSCQPHGQGTSCSSWQQNACQQSLLSDCELFKGRINPPRTVFELEQKFLNLDKYFPNEIQISIQTYVHQYLRARMN